MLTPEVLARIDLILHEQLDLIGYDHAEVEESEDHDGEPILSIDVHYRKVGDWVNPAPTFSLVRLLRDELRKHGETRFPHFRHLFPDDQKLKVA